MRRRNHPARAVRTHHGCHRRHPARRRHRATRGRRDRRTRRADRGLGQFHRRGRRQSRQGRGARWHFLLQALPARQLRRPVFPAGPRRLWRRSLLRERAFNSDRSERLGPSRRALDEPRLSSLALQLSAAHRAGAGRRAAAPCGDLPAAGLHRGEHCGRHVRQSGRRRLSLGARRRKLLGVLAGAIRRAQGSAGGCAQTEPAALARHGACSRSAPTT